MFFKIITKETIFLTIISPKSDSILFFLETFLKTTKSGFGRSVDIGYNIRKEKKFNLRYTNNHNNRKTNNFDLLHN